MSMHALLASAEQMTDDVILASARSLVGRERRLTAALVAHLAELDTRGLAQKKGFSSLFAYCRTVLGFSEAEACGRIEAARAARRFPLVLDLLQANELTMTAAGLLGRHLTPENHEVVLRAARGKTKDQIKEILAGLHPRPDVAPTIRAVATAPVVAAAPPAASVPPQPAVPPQPPVLEPLSPRRFRYQLTIDADTRDLLELARDVSETTPVNDADLLREALTLLVERRLRRKFAVTSSPRPARGTDPGSRHVPAAVKRQVYLRDLGRCAYVSEDGRRCNERRHIEFHHLKPYQAGGEATTDNISLRCRPHNQYESRIFFTRGHDVGRPTALPSAAPGGP